MEMFHLRIFEYRNAYASEKDVRWNQPTYKRYDQCLVIWNFSSCTSIPAGFLTHRSSHKTAFPKPSRQFIRLPRFLQWPCVRTWPCIPCSQWRDRTGLPPVSLLPAVRLFSWTFSQRQQHRMPLRLLLEIFYHLGNYNAREQFKNRDWRWPLSVTVFAKREQESLS